MVPYWISPILDIFIVDMGINWIGWAAAVLFKTEKFYDLTGSVTFIVSASLGIMWSESRSIRQIVQTTLVMIWTVRLGYYLVSRIMRDGRDSRFDDAKQKPLLYLVYWTLQGVWVFVTLLPTLLQLTNVEPFGHLTIANYVGWTVWAFGFIIEVVADFQKSRFRSNEANRGKFIQSGLWSLSRHPNYFGEITLWFGMYISAAASLSPYQQFSVLSPIFVYLLISQVSGVPMLERSGHARWGQTEEYQTYLRRTPVLVPFVRCYCLPPQSPP